MLLDPRNGPRFDHRTDPDARCFIIASTPRTGSTLLARCLWQAGLGAPKEYLNPTQLRDWEVRLGTPGSRWVHARLQGRAVGLAGRGWSTARIDQHVQRVRVRRTAGGWFGLKMHWHHFDRFFARRPAQAVFGPITWLRIQRTDTLQQAVSWEHAWQTGRWISTQVPQRPARYVRAAITRRLALIRAHERCWDLYLHGQDVTSIRYEDLISGPPALERVFRALGSNGQPSPLPLQPQRDASEWAHRYRAGR